MVHQVLAWMLKREDNFQLQVGPESLCVPSLLETFDLLYLSFLQVRGVGAKCG